MSNQSMRMDFVRFVGITQIRNQSMRTDFVRFVGITQIRSSRQAVSSMPLPNLHSRITKSKGLR